MPIAISIILGVGFIYYKRTTTPDNIVTGPILKVVPSYEADVSTIQNIIGTVHTMTKSNDLGALNGS